MVSSEVQRTLVKSPPELWAELSDPAALARHLGELGEIRITRVEPEQKVEWETDDTSGTVLIDPSGWGTRVTLTATRELAEPQSPPAANAPAEPQPSMQVEPEPATHAEPEPIVEAEPEPIVEAEPEPIVEAEPEPIVEAEPGPSVDAEREPVIAIDPEPTIETAAEVEHQRELDFVAELEPRRGFFARLFRRRAGAQPSLEATSEQASETPDAFAAVTQALAPATFAAAHPFAAAQLTAERTREPTEIDEPVRRWAEAELSAGAEWDEPDTWAEPEMPAKAEGWAELETWAEPHARADEETPAGSDIRAEADPEAQGIGDISAEIRAAEEVAAEQVAAVLTSVLDRLGAAHHRPFSRA